jgi:DNA-binding transcriptional regulator YdaS (Cro superfamily)
MATKLPKFKAYLDGKSVEEREAIAAAVGSSFGHLRNVAYGYRPCAPALAVALEQLSGGDVRRWDLLPDEWASIWPELVGMDGAPAVSSVSQARVA